MEPVYRIYHGQYPDACTTEIQNEHIRSLTLPSYRIEPGKPGEPKLQGASFVLDNLNYDGNQRYSSSWFEANSRTVANGATIPWQIFFRISVPTLSLEFIGVLERKTPGTHHEIVTVSLRHLLVQVLSGNQKMLGSFSFSQLKNYSGSGTQYDNTVLTDGIDLASNAITAERLTFFAVTSNGAVNATSESEVKNHPIIQEVINHEFLIHLNLNDINTWNITFDLVERVQFEALRPVFVKIGETILFTVIEVFRSSFASTDGVDSYNLGVAWGFHIWHASNANINTDELKVLQRGRFFKDSDGTDFATDDLIDIEIYDFNFGYDADVVAGASDISLLGTSFIHGVPYTVSQQQGVDFELSGAQNEVSHLDILTLTVSLISKNILDPFYLNTVTDPDIFDLDNAGGTRFVFFSDILQYGWLNDNIGALLADLATQTNSYLFINKDGKIAFQDRLLHEQHLPGSLPPAAFEIKLEDINPKGYNDDARGFESYKIEYQDRLSINNQDTGSTFTKHVSKDGVESKAALRNNSLTIGNYRTSNLGVPSNNDHPDLPLFRRSPEDSNWPDGTTTINDFIPDPVTIAQKFAASFSYPSRIWPIEISMAKYALTKPGGYCWVQQNGVNEVYFIREFHPDPDAMTIGLKLQYVGAYSG